jgi:hypothetical protein
MNLSFFVPLLLFAKANKGNDGRGGNPAMYIQIRVNYLNKIILL